jgi:cob(I)alamin adenosyltransferase
MKIYTRTGDTGETSVIGGTRLPKHHPRIEAYGTVDELIAWIGLLRSDEHDQVRSEELITIQSALMSCCTVIATPPSATLPEGVTIDGTPGLEHSIDAMESKLPPLKTFILPGGNRTAANANIARCICRRAERAVLRLNQTEKVDHDIIKYLNRLSDYLFVLTRYLTYETGNEEIKWPHPKKEK